MRLGEGQRVPKRLGTSYRCRQLLDGPIRLAEHPGNQRQVKLAELITVLPHDRGRRLQPNADTAALIDKSALGRYPPNDIFRSQYPRHFAATLTRIFASNAICGVN
jgi:hypothetical protein